MAKKRSKRTRVANQAPKPRVSRLNDAERQQAKDIPEGPWHAIFLFFWSHSSWVRVSLILLLLLGGGAILIWTQIPDAVKIGLLQPLLPQPHVSNEPPEVGAQDRAGHHGSAATSASAAAGRSRLHASVSDDNATMIVPEAEVAAFGGEATVRLWVYNTSAEHANNGNVWFKVYAPTEPVALPSQLNHVDGAPPGEVTGRFDHIGVSERTGPFDFRVRLRADQRQFKIGFRYSCETCAVDRVWQPVMIRVRS